MYVYLNDQQSEVTCEVLKYYEVQAECTDGTAELGLKAGKGNNANWEALADVHLYYLGREEVTGLTGIAAGQRNTDDRIYNLNGQRVDEGFRGIVIKNGKRFLNQ